ncbi:MAG: LptF/LptG family permease [Planctomycetota bacterium]
MLTTFDRYLLGRLIHTFIVFFVAAFGLYVVLDLFTNIDDFQENVSSNSQLFICIAEFYAYRAFEFFGLAGPILIVVSVITVLGLLRKNSETFPILAAGIPAFRLLRPLLISAGILNLALIANQEFVMPAIAVQLQTPRGSELASVQKVEPVYDYSNYLMFIAGEQILVNSQTLKDATFQIPEPELARQMTTLTAEEAIFVEKTSKHPSGWLLRNLRGEFDSSILMETLTDEGRRRVIPRSNGRDVFIVSEVSFDQLYNRGRNLRFLSSLQLLQRIQTPATGIVPVRSQSVALHTRLTGPILCLLNIAIALPLVFRKESHSLIANMATCATVLGVLYGITEASFALGREGLMPADLAAWLPVILIGSGSTWTSGLVQT